MGFPMGYSEFMIPKLVHVIFLLSYVRGFIQWSLSTVGLGNPMGYSECPWPDHSPLSPPHPELHSVSATLIEELLPVVKYEVLISNRCVDSEHNCAVCLYELVGGDEVRRLGNCRHVFHRRCIDRWIEHEQRTCPLCRTPLVPEEMQGVFNERMWAAAGIVDSYSDSNFVYD